MDAAVNTENFLLLHDLNCVKRKFSPKETIKFQGKFYKLAAKDHVVIVSHEGSWEVLLKTDDVEVPYIHPRKAKQLW